MGFWNSDDPRRGTGAKAVSSIFAARKGGGLEPDEDGPAATDDRFANDVVCASRFRYIPASSVPRRPDAVRKKDSQ